MINLVFDYKKYKEIKDFIKKNQKFTKIVAISKNQPKQSIIAALDNGVRVFGENKVQEATAKFQGIKELYPELELHLTGPLQTNKTKAALKIFDVFHTLDRKKLAHEFLKFPELLKNKKFFIQINTGEEPNKSGVTPKKAKEFIHYCILELKLDIVGLMCLPPINTEPKKHFELLRKIANESSLDELSMGMSDDYLEAIKLNATYIRLGTILFGKRK